MAIFNSGDWFEGRQKMETIIKAVETVAEYTCIDVDMYINSMYAMMYDYSPATDYEDLVKLEESFLDAFNEAVYWTQHG